MTVTGAVLCDRRGAVDRPRDGRDEQYLNGFNRCDICWKKKRAFVAV
jgi:hypothetical protein